MQTGVESIDHYLNGGLKQGIICECGTPLGRQGRFFILLFLRHTKALTLWVYGQEDLQVYPPSWSAQGIDLEKVYFIRESEPIKNLRPVFLEPTFPIIVIDTPKKLRQGDFSFLAHQARANKQNIFILRNYLLKNENGNPLTRYRFNCFFHNKSHSFQIQRVRGGSPHTLSLSKGDLQCQA